MGTASATKAGEVSEGYGNDLSQHEANQWVAETCSFPPVGLARRVKCAASELRRTPGHHPLPDRLSQHAPSLAANAGPQPLQHGGQGTDRAACGVRSY